MSAEEFRTFIAELVRNCLSKSKMEDKRQKFVFQPITERKFPSLQDKDNKDLLTKWSMLDNMNVQMFTFDQPFQPYQKNEFVLDLMQDANVISSLKVAASGSGGLVPLGMAAETVTSETVPCSVLSMSFFDRLYGSVVRDSGYLHKCFDEFVEDFTISDELRKMMLLEESDHYCLYDDAEKDEFLFRLFKHLCLGGQICQYEDTVDPYLNLTKQLYKELISVQKIPESKELNIISSVFKISAQDKDGNTFYPGDKLHDQTFSYLIVDPLKRHVIVFYHKFGGTVFR